MKIAKYNIIEFFPMFIALGILIILRTFYPGCVSKNCLGNAILISSAIAAVLSFFIYRNTQKIDSKIYYYSKLQKVRILLGSFLWIVLFIIILLDKIFVLF
ncbi:MAG: hypothetical protein HOP07_01875 [Bacteriovoracaceae bacterium]|nr:hypothetical protein [Bacteriovoracaceae bacterium]